MQVGDLVQATITGLGKPERSVMGMLIKPVAKYFWMVHLVEEQTNVLVEKEELEMVQ